MKFEHLPSVNLVQHDLKLQHGSSNIVGIEEPFRLNSGGILWRGRWLVLGGGGGVTGRAWTGFELCVGLRLIDFTLLVQGMQGVIERVGLNNSGLLL